MLGRMLWAGAGLGLFAALCFGAIGPACYHVPEPDCGFVCGPGGACPADYTCAADHVCHRDGTPASLVCAVDAAADAPRPDAPADAAGAADAAPADGAPGDGAPGDGAPADAAPPD